MRKSEEIMLDKIINWFRKSKFKREIIVNVEKLETRVAVMENGKLEEYMVEHPEEERLVGSIFKGRIQNLEHDLQAAFVDIGLSKNAFLHYWDMSPDVDAFLDDDEEAQKGSGKVANKGRGKKPKARSNRLSNEEIEKRFPKGSEIIVQVTKGPISTKGPRVTANLSIPGRYLVMMPGTRIRGVSKKIGDAKERLRLKKILDKLPLPENVGLVVRTVGAGAIAVILSLALFPLVSLLLYRLALSVSIIFLDYAGCESGSRTYTTFRSSLDAVIAVYALSVLVLIIEVIIFLKSGPVHISTFLDLALILIPPDFYIIIPLCKFENRQNATIWNF
jgi:hypothetical protein